MSGEFWLAIAYGAGMILVGGVAYRVVKRDYTLPRRTPDESQRDPVDRDRSSG